MIAFPLQGEFFHILRRTDRQGQVTGEIPNEGVRMRERLTRWNQYGYETDAIDKYRDAVRRSNRASLTVLSIIGLVVALLMTVYGVATKKESAGIVICLILLAAASAAFLVARKKESRRNTLLISGYVLSAALYMMSIYGTMAMDTDAFWIGTQIAVGVYLLDYAWRVGALQIASYGALMVAWVADGVEVTGSRLLFSLIYLAIGLVTFYTMNRTRVSLIMGREVSKKQADTDLLTGLLNRTAAEDAIAAALGDGEETDVMLLLDLDRFKSVNDRLGHQMGDKVLVEVSNDLKKIFRSTDVLCRLGGDEFIIFMRGVPEKQWAVQRAEHVVRTVRRWVTDGTTNIQVTASIGVVMTEGVEREYGAMYRAADIAMYFAKEQGGNRAVFYTKELPDEARTAVSARENAP